MVASASATAPTCIANQGTIVVSATGGTSPYIGTGSYLVNASAAYSFTVTDNKGCTSTVAGVMPGTTTVSVNAGANVTICSGSSVTLTATGNAATYLWNPGNKAGATVSFTPTTTTTYTVLATSSTGCTATSSVSVTVSKIPTKPGTISGLSSGVCSKNGLVYSIAPVAGATFYLWKLPAGFTIASGQGTTTLTVNAGIVASSVYIQVKAVNSCGSSDESKMTITSAPGIPVSISGPLNGVCQQQNVNYTTTAVAGATSYTWTVPSGVTIISGQGTTSLFVKFNSTFTTSGSITVKSVNTCGSSSARSVTVAAKPATPTVITYPATICKNQSGVVFSTPAIYGATSYTWTFPSGVTILLGANTNTVTVKFGTTAGTVKVTANNACGINSYKSISVAFSCRESNSSTDDGSFNLTVYPNPTKGKVNVEFTSDVTVDGLMKIVDLTGHLIITQRIVIQEGFNNFDMDLSDITSGMYLVVLESPSKSSSYLRIYKD